MDDKTSIKEFFAGKNIFLTGGSGFIGKALIDKLLRSCPKVGNIYILLRPKKGKCLYERVEEIVSSPLFEKLKREHPENIKKIVPINGDAAKSGLGLSDEDKDFLIEEIDIFYHAAASVKFDDFLREAVFINVRSAREAALLALEMKKIVLFMHVSTTYCNIENKEVIEEILYPSHGNWKEAITVAERCDTQTLNVLSQKYTGTFPNTYTFTKLLAEHCINDLLPEKVPTVICRPSVVVSTIADPFPGWVDNLNGPVGLLLAGGSGLLRTVYGDPEIDPDYMPVDSIVKIMLVATWHKVAFGDKNSLTVYHASKHNQIKIKQSIVVELGKKLYWDVPFEKKTWFPGNFMTKCWYLYYFNVILFHILPALLLDVVLKLAGYPPIIFKIQKKIYIGNTAVSPFMLKEWQFLNTKSMALFEIIPENEREEFNFKIRPAGEEGIYQFYLMGCEYARRYLLKENKDITQKTRIRTKRMYYLDQTMKMLFYAVTVWFIFIKVNVIGLCIRAFCDYWNNL